MSELRTKADAINRAGAAMQAAIDVTDDPTGDYGIAISAAAPAVVEVLWPEIERLRAELVDLRRQGVEAFWQGHRFGTCGLGLPPTTKLTGSREGASRRSG